jgi:hypothetical protein
MQLSFRLVRIRFEILRGERTCAAKQGRYDWSFGASEPSTGNQVGGWVLSRSPLARCGVKVDNNYLVAAFDGWVPSKMSFAANCCCVVTFGLQC